MVAEGVIGLDRDRALIARDGLFVAPLPGKAEQRRLGELAGRHLKRAHLELGGNSALIVLDDADLEQAVGAAAFGSFFHQGQACMAIGRHLVQDSIYPQYVQRLAAKADGLPVGMQVVGRTNTETLRAAMWLEREWHNLSP